VIRPELFQISDITGEANDKLWGMTRYGVGKWMDSIGIQTIKNSKKITVGIVDTGISSTHSDLKNRISQTIPGYDFVNDDSDPTDDQGHGTHVSGTIAGEINGS
jgi:thermitase